MDANNLTARLDAKNDPQGMGIIPAFGAYSCWDMHQKEWKRIWRWFYPLATRIAYSLQILWV